MIVIVAIPFAFCNCYIYNPKFKSYSSMLKYLKYICFIIGYMIGFIIVSPVIIPLLIQFSPICMICILFILSIYFISYDQSINLVCTYNSFCYYSSKYNWKKELFFRPNSSIFIKTCQKGFYRKIPKEILNTTDFIRSKSLEGIKMSTRFIIIKKFKKIFIKSKEKECEEEEGGKISSKEKESRKTLKPFYDSLSEYDSDRQKEFYNSLNGEAIIDFKWRTFGRYYYFLIWLIFMAFQICFIIGSLPKIPKTNEIHSQLYTTMITIGFIHLLFEFRQFI